MIEAILVLAVLFCLLQLTVQYYWHDTAKRLRAQRIAALKRKPNPYDARTYMGFALLILICIAVLYQCLVRG
jgi:hypothetical protein